MRGAGVTPARFAQGMTWTEYAAFVGTPENLAREGFDVRRFAAVRPRIDWSGYLRDRYAKARLTGQQAAAIRWLAAQPGGPAKVLAISEDWSSDCRRDVPHLARLAEAGGLELRIFTRDGDEMTKDQPDPARSPNADIMLAYMNSKDGGRFASVPVAVFYANDFEELYRYVEYPAIFHKSRLFGHLRKTGGDIGAVFASPLYDVWASAAIDEIVSGLYERLMTGGA
jgi:hypothetical protein